MEMSEKIIGIEKELATHDEALFGIWVSATHRQHGVVEKTNAILGKLPKIEKTMQIMMVLMAILALDAVGIPTKALVPTVFRMILHLLGS